MSETPVRRRRVPADLGARLVVAVPGATVLVALVVAGGAWLAVPLGVLAFLGHLELARLRGTARRAVALPGAVAAGALPLLALGGGEVLVAGGAAALALALALALPHGARAAGTNALGVLWIGGCLAHGVLLRELDHGGALVVTVLLATFLGDTAAQFAGTAFGRTKLAPAISPNKTVEGLLAGIAGGTLAGAAFLAGFHDWAPWGEAALLALAAALAAPAGDLFESALKRRAGVKDSGRAFGAHGGVLDRIDAALAAVLVGHYVALAVA